jgi:hypothetical protein
MGVDPKASVIHRIVYTGNDGWEHIALALQLGTNH